MPPQPISDAIDILQKGRSHLALLSQCPTGPGWGPGGTPTPGSDSGGPGAGSDFSSVASNLVAASNLSVAGSSSEFFPAEMAEILGQPTVTSTLANGLTGSAFGPPHGLASDYSDLNRSLHQASSHLHPLSNLSMESRGSTEEESEEMNSRDKVSSSGISKAFRALNDFGNVYSTYD